MPVVVGAPVPLLLVLFSLTQPAGAALAVMASVAALIVVPTVLAAGRNDLPPARTLVRGALWGATFAVTFAALLNQAGSALLGLRSGDPVGDLLSAVLIAPPVEETAKLLGVLWLSRGICNRLQLLVVAACVAVGFTVVEDLLYLGMAGDAAGQTFVVRALLTPFSHPLFTFCSAAGLAAARSRRRRWPLVAGAIAAVLLHASFNAVITGLGSGMPAGLLLCGLAYLVVMFAAGMIVLFATASAHRRTMLVNARRLGAPEPLVELLGSVTARRRFRRRVPAAVDADMLRQVRALRAVTRPGADPDPIAPPGVGTPPFGDAHVHVPAPGCAPGHAVLPPLSLPAAPPQPPAPPSPPPAG